MAETVLLKSPLEVVCDDNIPSSHKSQDEEDLLGAIIVTRPHMFELSNSVSEAVRTRKRTGYPITCHHRK